MQGVDLALVGQQLDDDDRAGKCQRHRDIHRPSSPCPAPAEHEAEQMVKASCPSPVANATGPMWRTWFRSSFRPDDEEQDRHADLGQQVDLVVGRHQLEPGRPHGDTHHDVGDEDGLAQPDRHDTGQGREGQQDRDLHKGLVHGALDLQGFGRDLVPPRLGLVSVSGSRAGPRLPAAHLGEGAAPLG